VIAWIYTFLQAQTGSLLVSSAKLKERTAFCSLRQISMAKVAIPDHSRSPRNGRHRGCQVIFLCVHVGAIGTPRPCPHTRTHTHLHLSPSFYN
jgi:hypothetical protein